MPASGVPGVLLVIFRLPSLVVNTATEGSKAQISIPPGPEELQAYVKLQPAYVEKPGVTPKPATSS